MDPYKKAFLASLRAYASHYCSLTALAASAAALCMTIGCTSPIRITQPQDQSLVFEETVPLILEYTQCDPSTLKVVLNGEDITGQMEISETSARHPGAPLGFGPNTLTATIQSVPGRWPFTQRITIYRLVPYELYGAAPKPSGMVFDPSGNLYVARDEPGPVRILRIPPGGGSGSEFGPLCVRPKTLTLDTDGNLFVASVGTGTQIYKVHQDGSSEPLFTSTAPFQDVRSLFFLPKGTQFFPHEYGPCLFASVTTFEGEQTLMRITLEDGSFRPFAQGLPAPVGALVQGAEGQLFILAGQGLYTVPTKYSFTEYLHYDDVGTNCLATNRDTLFFAADASSQRLVTLTASGGTFPVAVGLSDIRALALGPGGDLYFADRAQEQIFRIPYDFRSLRSGTASLAPSGPIPAGSSGTWKITYMVGVAGMAEDGKLMIGFRHPMDWGDVQTSSPSQPNYVTARCSRPATSVKATSGFDGIELSVSGAPLRRGDTIELTLGDTSWGSLGQQAPTIAAEQTELFVFDDIYGKGDFDSLLTVPPERTLRYDVLPSAPDHLVVSVKSYARTQQPSSVSIRAVDAFGNIAAEYTGTVTIRDAATGEVLGTSEFGPDDRGFKLFERILFQTAGIKRLLVQDESRGWGTTSNPIVVSEGPLEEYVFWGDIHGHSLLSDGLPTPERYYEVAKSVNQLDFAALSDHVGSPWETPSFAKNVLNEATYEVVKTAADAYYSPGSFVTFVGYECSTSFGHRNVYYSIPDPPFVPWENDPVLFFESVRSSAPAGQVMVIGHQHSGIPGDPMSGIDWSTFAPDLEKAVEICSNKGVREYAGNRYFQCDKDALWRGFLQVVTQDALAMGLRFGFAANSDNHTGWPGGGSPGRKTCPIFGLTGIRASSLTRESIFDAYLSKRTVATTGARILLDFRLNGEPMGSELPFTNERTLEVEVHATAPLRSLSIIKNNRTLFSSTDPQMDVSFSLSDTSSLPSDFYYVRVIQEDGHLAWSSPIWVGP